MRGQGPIMPAHLLDTGILIRHLRGNAAYATLLQNMAQDGPLLVSAFTRVEILRGMRDHERQATMALLDALLTVPLDRESADVAGEWLRVYRSRGVTLSGPDAVIAAAALVSGASLVTTNPRHFPMPELQVLAVDEEGRASDASRRD